MSGSERVVVVPGTPGLLPRNAGLTDAFAELRTASLEAVAWLLDGSPEPVLVLTAAAVGPRGVEVAEHLLSAAGLSVTDGTVTHRAVPRDAGPALDLAGRPVLVVADGSAKRGERAPGHVDPRAAGFDAAVGAALRAGDPAALRGIDLDLGDELLAEGAPVLRALGAAVTSVQETHVEYEDDPFGVQYWVVRWVCTAEKSA